MGDTEGPLAHVRYLADDALEGREVASQGERCAAEYIAARFEAAGLQPAGDSGTWTQAFAVRAGSRPGDDNALVVGGEDLAVGEDWTPWGFSGTGRVEGTLVYAASGLSRDTSGAATAEGQVSVSGRIAVIEAATEGAPAGSFQTDPHFKASVARGREAAAVVLLLEEGEPLPSMDRERRPFVGVPVVAVRGPAAESLREAARAEATASITTTVEPRMGEALNVVGLLPGSDPDRADEVVVVGAHYDHLGWGGDGSLAPDAIDIHNGADDNASGTAALIAVAEALADGPAPARPVLFLGFSGEEKGLLGSAHYVSDPTVALDD
ncbi:MAG: M28 family peptidase, partial [Gemmatimonadetes bacterium]|nr:M28 family peptidase [Gemmatimonadota bacterium]